MTQWLKKKKFIWNREKMWSAMLFTTNHIVESETNPV